LLVSGSSLDQSNIFFSFSQSFFLKAFFDSVNIIIYFKNYFKELLFLKKH
jgi:hypothetical protein